MNIPWRAIGLGTAIALPLAGLPAGYNIHKALTERDEILARVKALQDNQLPTAAIAGTGAALLAGIATYNTMKTNAEKKGWREPSKYASFALVGYLVKSAMGPLGKGLVGGVTAGAPLGLLGYIASQRALADARQRLTEGDLKLKYWENNMIPLSMGAGALAGGIGTAAISRKRFQMPEAQMPEYFDPNMMR